ncbi:hypothetical protein JKP88DRAFT_234264 [Tribonema minus]|uniref:Uncharacterized protein n=1 Tax=Tribonema minus TaxID=303371 RepID=A0A835Z653_9STRA|nr:hypothetical protein JKP88DRAFT_234264 [Tribonema minus]
MRCWVLDSIVAAGLYIYVGAVAVGADAVPPPRLLDRAASRPTPPIVRHTAKLGASAPKLARVCLLRSDHRVAAATCAS